MMDDILLIGGGGHCRSVIDVIEQQSQYKIVGIIDKKERVGTTVLDYKTIGCDDDLEELFESYKNTIVTVGQTISNDIRVKLFNKLKKIGFNLPVIISPLAYVSKSATLEEGSIVMHGSIVNANAKIGKNCIINTKSLIEHDVVVEDNCHVSTGAIINGGVCIKENTFIGSNATSKEYTIVDGFIKAGSVVK